MSAAALRPGELASPDLADVPASAPLQRWRGYVDGWDPHNGFHGWVLAADVPDATLQLELVVDDRVVYVVESGLPRPDIAQLVGMTVTPGFRFGPDSYARIAQSGAPAQTARVNIRVAGTDALLLPADRAPVMAQLVDDWRAHVLDTVRGVTVTEDTPAERLLARLTALRMEAGALLDLPLRPISEREAGRIEVMFMVSEGQVWLSGWIQRGMDVEVPVVIADRLKYPGAMALFTYERQDLATLYQGFLALLDTAWAPAPVTREFFAYVGQGGRFQLRAGPATRLIRQEDFLALFQEVAPRAVSGPALALGAVLSTESAWLPVPADIGGFLAEASVDRMLMLPGFGCLVEGWVVCPTRKLRALQLKIGDCVLVSDGMATYFKSRPDLQHVFQGGQGLVTRAGFVTALRGAVPERVTGIPLLKVIYEDGMSSVHRLDGKRLHRLDPLSDAVEVLRLFPSFEQEPFFGEFVAAVRRGLRARVGEPQILALATARKVLVQGLPAGQDLLRLCFDQLAVRLEVASRQVGLALLMDRSEGLSMAKAMFRELQARHPARALSLVCLDDPQGGFASLPFLLTHLGAERFVFVDRGLMPTTRGWIHALRSLELAEDELSYLEVVDDTGQPDRVFGSLGAGCFSWSTLGLLAWLPRSVPFLRGVHGDNGLPAPPSGPRVLGGAAVRIEAPAPSRLADLIDAALLKGIETP